LYPLAGKPFSYSGHHGLPVPPSRCYPAFGRARTQSCDGSPSPLGPGPVGARPGPAPLCNCGCMTWGPGPSAGLVKGGAWAGLWGLGGLAIRRAEFSAGGRTRPGMINTMLYHLLRKSCRSAGPRPPTLTEPQAGSVSADVPYWCLHVPQGSSGWSGTSGPRPNRGASTYWWPRGICAPVLHLTGGPGFAKTTLMAHTSANAAHRQGSHTWVSMFYVAQSCFLAGHRASGPDFGRMLIGKVVKSAHRRKADFGAVPDTTRPTSGREPRFPARRHYCATLNANPRLWPLPGQPDHTQTSIK
jgi:hypothetical protein